MVTMIYIDILVSKMKGDPAGAANPSCRIIRNLLNLRSGFLCTLSSSCVKRHQSLEATTFYLTTHRYEARGVDTKT